MKKILFAAALMGLGSLAHAAWTPPPQPDPGVILREARADREAGRFDDALAKHLWFHHHALEIQPSMGGVRLSFALSDWRDLAQRHPAAMTQLVAVRDAGMERMQRHPAAAAAAAFEVLRVDQVLGQSGHVRTLFEWLDQNRPEIADSVFAEALPDLVQERALPLASRYLKDAEEAFAAKRRFYAEIEKLSSKRPGEDMARQRAQTDHSLAREAALLLFVLSQSGRPAEAKALEAQARKVVKAEGSLRMIELALQGKPPAPMVW